MVSIPTSTVLQCYWKMKPFGLNTIKMLYNSRRQLNRCTKHVVYQEVHGNKYCGIRRRCIAIKTKSFKDDPGSCNEHSALETVLKLYNAMRNRNVHEISDIIAEECLCVSNLDSLLQPLHGKKQVMDFFAFLMKKFGNNIEFVVQNTVNDGMVVGVSWNLEWNNVPLPLGKGFSLYMCHVYQGKVMIKNVEIFMEPLLHIEPLRLKVITQVMNVMEKINIWFHFKDKRRVLTVLSILLVAAILFHT